jgi:predicted ABC-type ATPase
MKTPQFVLVAGCNAAGKSSFIRSRINQLEDFEIIMTDVYKSRSRDVVEKAFSLNRNVVLETVFNNESFKDLVDKARDRGYHTSLVLLFLDTPQQSINRVATRSIEQGGIYISGPNIKWNFNQSFKNVALYYLYFDQSDFIYTGTTGKNRFVMRFEKSRLVEYHKTELQYSQKFAEYSFRWQRLNEETYKIITTNEDYIDQ